MKIFGTKTIPAQPERTETVVVGCKCDLCGADGKDGFDSSKWKGCDIDKTALKMTTEVIRENGESYPEGGSKKVQWFDVCPDCWKTKVVPWFESQGAKVSEREDSW